MTPNHDDFYKEVENMDFDGIMREGAAAFLRHIREREHLSQRE